MHAQHFDWSRTGRGALFAPPRRVARSCGDIRLKPDGEPAQTPCGAYPGEDGIAALAQAASVNARHIRIPPHAAPAVRELHSQTLMVTTISQAVA